MVLSIIKNTKLLITPALLGLIISFQYYYDKLETRRPIIPPTIIPAQILRLTNLGLDSATGVILWIQAIQKMTDVPIIILPKLIRNINDIDPKFSYPYAFAALLLPGAGFPDEAVEIARIGIEKNHADWRIPYYLATTYHIFLKDRQSAAFYFDLASITPGAPENIKTIAVRYGARKNPRDQTKEIWTSIYGTTGDDIIKERARDYVIQIEILEFLERAIRIHKEKYGFYPKNTDDLITRKIIKEIPPSPFEVEYHIQTDGQINIQ